MLVDAVYCTPIHMQSWDGWWEEWWVGGMVLSCTSLSLSDLPAITVPHSHDVLLAACPLLLAPFQPESLIISAVQQYASMAGC